MIKETIPSTKYKVGMNLISRKERERMYFLKLEESNNRKFEERKNRRDKIQKIWKQPEGNKYIELYYRTILWIV